MVQDGEFLILSDYDSSADLFGYSKFDLAKLYSPGMVLYLFSKFILTGWLEIITWAVLAVFLVVMTIGVLATPDHMGPVDYIRIIIRHYTRQQILLHERQPQPFTVGEPVDGHPDSEIGPGGEESATTGETQTQSIAD